MTPRERLLTALERKIPDRLPVTTHHVMPYLIETYMNGISASEFFDYFQLDATHWLSAHKPDKDNFIDPAQEKPGYLEHYFICSDNWRIEREIVDNRKNSTVRFIFVTPAGNLTMALQHNEYSTWVVEPLIKDKSDIDVFAQYATAPLCDVEEVNRQAEEIGDSGIIRGAIPGFDIYGQPGCWQDAAVLFGIENLITESFNDPDWVHTFLNIFLERKGKFIDSTKGAKFDLIEHGGGSASSTIISPSIFYDFVAPYDEKLTKLAHKYGHKIVYHTCGGMMPILENILAMNPDAIETFTPKEMGGDVDLFQAKKTVEAKVCMIGGFDQFHYLKDCSPEETRKAVRKCFAAAGEGGGYILAPSDHFFDADIECLKAFAEEAKNCIYN